jgi:hypothetical protein
VQFFAGFVVEFQLEVFVTSTFVFGSDLVANLFAATIVSLVARMNLFTSFSIFLTQ